MNSDQDLDLRVGRWLDAREVPVSAERVSDRILATLATTRQERRPILRRGPITRPPLRLLAVAAALIVAGGLAAVIGLGGRPALVFVPPPTSVVGPDQHAEPVSAAGSPDRSRGRHLAGPRDAVPSLGPGRRPGHHGDRSCHGSAGSHGRRRILDIPGGRRALGPEGRGAGPRARRPADGTRAGAVRRHPGVHGCQGWRHGLGVRRERQRRPRRHGDR